MADTLTDQTSEIMTTSQYATEIEKQKKEIRKQRFPARTLKFQQEVISKITPKERARITQKKETFVGKRKGALGKLTAEEKRVAKEIEGQLESTGDLTNYTTAYESQPQTFRQHIKSPQKKQEELQAESQKLIAEIQRAEESLAKAQAERAESETTSEEHDAEEDILFYQTQINKLSEGKALIDRGRFLKSNQVVSLADQVASQERDILDQKNALLEQGLTAVTESGVTIGFADLGQIGKFGSKVSVKKLAEEGVTTIKDRGVVTGFELIKPTEVTADVQPTEYYDSIIAPTKIDGKDLNITDSLGGYGVQSDVSSRTDLGFFGKIRSAITGAATRVVGSEEDFKKATDIFTPTFGTVSAAPTISPELEPALSNIQTKPFLTERLTGEFIKIDGKERPLTETIFVDPTVMGKQFERPATFEEVKSFETFKSALRTPEESASLGIMPTTFIGEQSFGQKIGTKARDIVPSIETWGGFDLRSPQKGFVATEEFLVKGAEKLLPGKTGKITGGFVKGIFPTTPGEVGTYAVTAGIGGILGFGVKGTAYAASKVPKYGSLLSSGIKGGAALGGTYLTGKYVLGVGTAVAATEDYGTKGEIIGKASGEFLALGAGFKAGSKGFDMFKGWKSTLGRKEIPIERLVPEDVLTGKKTFPTATSESHLELFKSTAERFPELAEGKPGAFHTTPSKFWKGAIEPQAGTSELPGLYASSDVSIHFAKLGGAGESKFRFFPRFSEMFAPEGDSAIAFLKPKRFRVNPFTGKARKPIIEGGERVKEFAWFKKPVKEGVADIPKMKTEIEAVFREGSGKYELTGQKYYTTYRGIKIPIDTFKYVEGTGKGGKPKTRTKILTSETSGYSLQPIQEYALIEPRSFLGKSYKESYKSSSKISGISYLGGYSKPSIIGSSKVSKISSRILSPISYKPSSKISSGISSPVSKSTTKSYVVPSYDFNLIPPPTKRKKKDRFKEKKKKKPKRKIFTPTGYLPSFTALTFGIKGKAKKIGKTYAPTVRPIIDLPEVKTSKKKKKKLKVKI